MNRLFALCLALVLACMQPVAAETLASDRYTNPTLGFSVTKPAEWHWMSAQQHRENLSRVRMGSEEFQKLVAQQSTTPLVVMTRHPEPYDGLNASFRANIRAFGAGMPRDPKVLLAGILPTLQQQMADARVATPVEAVTVAGLPAAHAVLDYTLRSAEGGEFPTTSEIWIVPVGDHFYMLGAGYSQGDAETRSDIAAILTTLLLGSESAAPREGATGR